MTTEIDWNLIELTEIYESFDMALRLLDEDTERVMRLIDVAIEHGATPESMTEPVKEFAIGLQICCEKINKLKDQKKNKTQKT